TLAHRAQPLHRVDRRHVELVAAGLHLRLHLAVGDRRDGANLDAGRRGERLEVGGLLRRHVAAAPGIDVERARLRDGALGDEEGPDERGGAALEEDAAMAVETEGGFHRGLPVFLLPLPLRGKERRRCTSLTCYPFASTLASAGDHDSRSV